MEQSARYRPPARPIGKLKFVSDSDANNNSHGGPAVLRRGGGPQLRPSTSADEPHIRVAAAASCFPSSSEVACAEPSSAAPFSRQVRHRKSALGSIKRWMRRALLPSNSAGGEPRRHHRRSLSIDNLSSERRLTSDGGGAGDAARLSADPADNEFYERPEFASRQQSWRRSNKSAKLTTELPVVGRPPVPAHRRTEATAQLRSARDRTPVAVNRVAGGGGGSQPMSRNSSQEFYRQAQPVDEDSGVDTPSWDRQLSAALRDLPSPGVSGVVNHGNTCYVNAIIQCLNNTDALAQYLVSEGYLNRLKELNHVQQKNSRRYGTEGILTKELSAFLQSLWFNLYTEKISRNFKTLIGQFSSVYKGAYQQDAQEFVMWLLDKMHEDLNTATQRKYKTGKGRGYSSEDDLADATLNRHRKAHCSFVTNLFEAQFRSSVACPDCKKSKLNFDPFIFLRSQLTIAVEFSTSKPLFVTLCHCAASRRGQTRLLRLGLNADITAHVKDVKSCLKSALSSLMSSGSELLICALTEQGFGIVYNDTVNMTALESGVDLYAVELPRVCSEPAEQQYPPSSAEEPSTSATESSLHEVTIVALNVLQSSAEKMKRRFAQPVSVRVHREASYSELCCALVGAIQPQLRPSAAADLARLKFPEDVFCLRIVDEYSTGHLLLADVAMPLFTEFVERALSHQQRKPEEAHLRVLLEWRPNRWQSYLRNSEEHVAEHESADDLRAEIAEAKPHTLRDCLTLYTRPEFIEWRCDSCRRVQSRAEKSLLFWSLPDVLIIHLKRFKQFSDGQQVKLEHLIEFPIDGLDLTKFTYQSTGLTPIPLRRHWIGKQDQKNGDHRNGYIVNRRRTPSGGSGRYESTDVFMHGDAKQVNGFVAEEAGRPALYMNANPCSQHSIYDLYAVCNHHGDTVNSGHYTAYCRNPIDGRWRCFDDDKVTLIDEKKLVTASAYLLFYERRGVRNSRSLSGRGSTESGFIEHWFYNLPPALIRRFVDLSIAPASQQPQGGAGERGKFVAEHEPTIRRFAYAKPPNPPSFPIARSAVRNSEELRTMSKQETVI